MTAKPAAKDVSALFGWVFEWHEILDIKRWQLVQRGEMSEEHLGWPNEAAAGDRADTRPKRALPLVCVLFVVGDRRVAFVRARDEDATDDALHDTATLGESALALR